MFIILMESFNCSFVHSFIQDVSQHQETGQVLKGDLTVSVKGIWKEHLPWIVIIKPGEQQIRTILAIESLYVMGCPCEANFWIICLSVPNSFISLAVFCFLFQKRITTWFSLYLHQVEKFYKISIQSEPWEDPSLTDSDVRALKRHVYNKEHGMVGWENTRVKARGQTHWARVTKWVTWASFCSSGNWSTYVPHRTSGVIKCRITLYVMHIQLHTLLINLILNCHSLFCKCLTSFPFSIFSEKNKCSYSSRYWGLSSVPSTGFCYSLLSDSPNLSHIIYLSTNSKIKGYLKFSPFPS